MGVLKKLVLGRWLLRWLFRGAPGTVAAKLAGVALFGAWKWRRERRREEAERRAREIPADYDVLEDRPSGRLPGTPGGEEG